MHSAIYYRVLGMTAPVVLVGIGRASGRRWAATTLAAMYTGLCAYVVDAACRRGERFRN
jgi:hypothetical protein